MFIQSARPHVPSYLHSFKSTNSNRITHFQQCLKALFMMWMKSWYCDYQDEAAILVLHITHSLKQTDINYHNIKIHLQPVPWKCSLNIRGPNLVLWKAKDYGLSSLKKVKTQILNEELNVRVWRHPMISFSLPRLSLSVSGVTIHLQYCCMMSDFRVQFEIHIFTLEASTHTKRTMHVLPGKTTKYPQECRFFIIVINY